MKKQLTMSSYTFARFLLCQGQKQKQSFRPSKILIKSSSRPFSSSTEPPPCDVVQGPSLLRTPVTRPSPSLLFLPGLRSLPFWTSPDFKRIAYGDPVVSRVVEHLEKHAEIIRQEYLLQKKQEKLPPTNDYHDHQKSLHEGKWEWFSYLSKGNIQGNFVSYW